MVDRFQAQVMVTELPEHSLFTVGFNAVLHIHTCVEEVTVEKVRTHALTRVIFHFHTPHLCTYIYTPFLGQTCMPSVVSPCVFARVPSNVQLISEVDKKTGENKPGRPRFVREGSLCVVQLKTAHTLPAETYEVLQQLGRFTLRNAGAVGLSEHCRRASCVPFARLPAISLCFPGCTIGIGNILKLPRTEAPVGAVGGAGAASK